MIQLLTSVDWIILLLLFGLMTVAVAYGKRHAKGSEQYFMAGRSLRWWSVAGSIYGTNVSLTQIIGMLGIGYSIGFAQSHYEILAIPAILVLCYVFIPVYRRKGVFTLSEYLENRYNATIRLLYSLIILGVIIVLLTGGFYIGSRQLGLLFQLPGFNLSYDAGIIIIAGLSCLLVYAGGMASVVIAENIITVLMVMTVLLVGAFTLYQPEINGISGLLQLDRQQPLHLQKMHLYLPPAHPDLPWPGVFTGLMVLHGFFWTTNQFEMQRILAARSNREARLGALAAGFLKLSIPFFSISAGVAAAWLFQHKYKLGNVKPDDAFMVLVQQVIPAGYGFLGLILAGFTGAIFSSIYAMLNAASTLMSVDIYKKYISKNSSDQSMVRFGQFSVVGVCLLAALLAKLTFDPHSAGNFFLTLSKNSSYLKPGIVSAFFLGILWKRTTAASAAAAIIAAPVTGWALEHAYAWLISVYPAVAMYAGHQLNFMYRVMLTFLVCLMLQYIISMRWPAGHHQQANASEMMQGAAGKIIPMLLPLGLTILLGAAIYFDMLTAAPGAGIAAILWPLAFLIPYRRRLQAGHREPLYQSDLFYAGCLAGITAWCLLYFI